MYQGCYHQISPAQGVALLEMTRAAEGAQLLIYSLYLFRIKANILFSQTVSSALFKTIRVSENI